MAALTKQATFGCDAAPGKVPEWGRSCGSEGLFPETRPSLFLRYGRECGMMLYQEINICSISERMHEGTSQEAVGGDEGRSWHQTARVTWDGILLSHLTSWVASLELASYLCHLRLRVQIGNMGVIHVVVGIKQAQFWKVLISTVQSTKKVLTECQLCPTSLGGWSWLHHFFPL